MDTKPLLSLQIKRLARRCKLPARVWWMVSGANFQKPAPIPAYYIMLCQAGNLSLNGDEPLNQARAHFQIAAPRQMCYDVPAKKQTSVQGFETNL